MLQKRIDTLEIENNTWHIYTKEHNILIYVNVPETCCGVYVEYRIIIEHDTSQNYFKFDARDYGDYTGPEGWNKWNNWSENLKNVILKDAMEKFKLDKKCSECYDTGVTYIKEDTDNCDKEFYMKIKCKCK